ncbi:CHAT domain-containing tetratricopeptide repeat protein [uncultured Draconibacterium sp.]|uniref:CHAT domain-containing protein n=1 Tax=uncultured Draconibacterium sp. TaxID=1573823 RepID=UPI0025F5CEFC|nr:CHAT domain-containing tetratricopeptide repeat protein [uncultured Draconibacterium sp.]
MKKILFWSYNSQDQMKILKSFKLILFLIILPNMLFSQELNKDSLNLTANNLRQKGVLYTREGNHTAALEAFQQYLAYRKKIYGNEDYYLATAYSAIGISYKNLGENEKALEYYLQAEKNIFLRNPLNYGLLGGLYINIGNVYRAKLDYNNALKYINQALNIYKSQTPINKGNLVDAYYAIAEIYYSTENFEKVISIAEESYSIADTINQIYFDNIVAGSYFSLENNENANSYYNHAISLSKQFYGSSLDLANAYLDYAKFLSQTNRFVQALENLNEAFQIFAVLEKSSGIELSTYYEYEGDLYRNRTIKTQRIANFKNEKKQNLLKAIDSYKKGLEALEVSQTTPETSEINFEQTISLMDCIGLIKAIGDVYLEIAILDSEQKGQEFSSNLTYALSCYNNTGNLIQKARKELSSDESKIQLVGLQYQTISKIIETAYLAYNHSGNPNFLNIAFNNSEQLKSSAVFDKIANDLAQENSLIPDSLLELERTLNNTISNYTELQYKESSSDEPDSTLLSEYKNRMFNASRQRDELNRFMEENYPDYYELKYSNTLPELHLIQKQLDKKHALVEYVLIDPVEMEAKLNDKTDSLPSLYTFVITNNEVLFNKSKLNKLETDALDVTFKFMSSTDYMFTQNEDTRNFCTSSNRLYKLLIKPFELMLKDKNITIIPDGKLNYIAFDGLLKTLPDTSSTIRFNELDYFLMHANINYANSVNIYLKNQSDKPKFRNHALAFAPEYASEEFEMTGKRYQLSPIPGVIKEVSAISKSVKTTIYSKSEATEENFRKECGKYDILHLAMHAYINDSLPAYSRLAFSQKADSAKLTNDGWLNTADIYNLNLNAGMTVLSACNTGTGKLQHGEGLMSLARGFLYAGCPSIVMSLWEVEDEAGTQIMTSFYKYLRGGKPKDEALRLAKINYLENSNSRLAHPHYWMSFKCIGDNSPVYTSYDIYFFVILVVLIIAFSIDQGVRIKKARRNRQA